MTAQFHEVRFPIDIAIRSSGGPERKTEIVTLASGAEQRNARWADARRSFNAGYGTTTLEKLQAVVAFFEERRGQLYGFRFRDPLDYSAVAQVIGTGTGAAQTLQLVKRYGEGEYAYVRAITKPVQGSVAVYVNGVLKIEDTDYSVDYSTGQVSFLAGHYPASGHGITADFQFDVPVRFNTDRLDINLTAFAAGEIPNIPLVEVRV